MSTFRMIAEHAKELANMGDDWSVYQWERLPHKDAKLTRVKGAIAPALLSGPSKGRPNWKKMDRSTQRELYITDREHEDWVKAREERTGQCTICEGTGQEFAGWSVTDGVKTRPCFKCNATGKPIALATP